MKKLAIVLFCLLFSCLAIGDEVLNVYNWSGYMPDEVLKQFESETGIHVYYSTYDSNETLYAKLKANPNAGYDIIVPSTYYLDKMRQENMLHKIDKAKLSNFKHLSPQLLNQVFDPNNSYSIPYFWGTTAIVVNSRYYDPNKIKRWADLWQAQYHDQIMLLDDMREVFSMALISLGYSPNDTNENHIHEAYLKLKTLLPNVKLFNAEAEQSIYIDEDVSLGMGWSGDIFLAKQENTNIHYIYPEEGFVIWIDNLAIPAKAKHLNNAHRFINFILRPDVAAKISMKTGYASANASAIKLLPKSISHSQIIYPDAKTLKRGKVQTEVGKAISLYEHYWERLKIDS